MTKKLILGKKTCQNAENKQTFDLTRKIEFGGKTLQNMENKQNFSGKIEFEGKTRQKAENKQTFDLTRKIIFRVSFLNLASNSRQIPDFFCKNSVNSLFSKTRLKITFSDGPRRMIFLVNYYVVTNISV